jgi:hypothetical protein
MYASVIVQPHRTPTSQFQYWIWLGADIWLPESSSCNSCNACDSASDNTNDSQTEHELGKITLSLLQHHHWLEPTKHTFWTVISASLCLVNSRHHLQVRIHVDVVWLRSYSIIEARLAQSGQLVDTTALICCSIESLISECKTDKIHHWNWDIAIPMLTLRSRFSNNWLCTKYWRLTASQRPIGRITPFIRDWANA